MTRPLLHSPFRTRLGLVPPLCVKSFFQKLSPCLVGIEACASSHHWSRELTAFHTVEHLKPEEVEVDLLEGLMIVEPDKASH